jgi:hypothetical protein
MPSYWFANTTRRALLSSEKFGRKTFGVSLRVPGLSRDTPHAHVFYQQHHFDASYHVGVVLCDLATGDRNGHVAKNLNLDPENGFGEGAELASGEAPHALDKSFGGLRCDRTRRGIERSAGQEVGREGGPIAGRARPPVQTPELSRNELADRGFIIGHDVNPLTVIVWPKATGPCAARQSL